MAMRNGHKIATKMKQVPLSYSASLALVGKTCMRNVSMTKSLHDLACESSSRGDLAKSVPFFAFDHSLVATNNLGQMKVVHQRVPEVKMLRKKQDTLKSARRGYSSQGTSKRLKALLQTKIRTPRSLAPYQNRTRDSYQEVRKENPHRWSADPLAILLRDPFPTDKQFRAWYYN